ncbi:MAG TPA: hypothetical protein DCM87_05845 [Planctomycetes bacterium]|nr:hypothetical protein [Planctomycetota bacterium]
MAKIVGEIVAVDWDSNDEPTDVCLQTESERYHVERGESFQELLAYVGCEVEVNGYVDENEDGEPVLAVRDFEVLDTFEEEKEDAEEPDDLQGDEIGESMDAEEELSKDEDW